MWGWSRKLWHSLKKVWPQGLKPPMVLVLLIYGLKPVPFTLKHVGLEQEAVAQFEEGPASGTKAPR